MIGVHCDDPSVTAPADLRSHAGSEVGPDHSVAPPLEEVVLPAGRHAVLTFTGPGAGLPGADEPLYEVWLPAGNDQPANSPPFEVCLDSPMVTPQDRLVTEICVPLT